MNTSKEYKEVAQSGALWFIRQPVIFNFHFVYFLGFEFYFLVVTSNIENIHISEEISPI